MAREPVKLIPRHKETPLVPLAQHVYRGKTDGRYPRASDGLTSIHFPPVYFSCLNLHRHCEGAARVQVRSGEGLSENRTDWAGSHSVSKSSFGIPPRHT